VIKFLIVGVLVSLCIYCVSCKPCKAGAFNEILRILAENDILGLQSELECSYSESELAKKRLKRLQDELESCKRSNTELIERLTSAPPGNLVILPLVFIITTIHMIPQIKSVSLSW
jgi:hypothetical protein